MLEAQPVSVVTWIARDELKANNYNPNLVAPPELKLLRISILTDGWTQPLVIRDDNEIVDGFHRWLVAKDKEIAALTEGLIPVVVIHPETAEDQMMSTIRHNRARGNHLVMKMADLVQFMIKRGRKPKEIAEKLQMEPEEVDRLSDESGMTERGSREDFGRGWVPQ
jgi:ParB-like chromosome segregation protein Spo0J